MSESLVKGSGVGLNATTVFQLLDPSSIYGAGSFRYDFYIEAGVAGEGVWQIDSDGSGDWADISSTDVDAVGEVQFTRNVEITSVSAGSVRISRAAGVLNYWYALKGGAGGGALPTVRQISGASDATKEFFVESGRVYTIVSDGNHTWNYARDKAAAAWTAFTEGTTNGFTFNSPSTGRIQLVPSGDVNFSITSTKA